MANNTLQLIELPRFLSVRRNGPTRRIGVLWIGDRTFTQSACDEPLPFTNALDFDRRGVDSAFDALQTFRKLRWQRSDMSWPLDPGQDHLRAGPKSGYHAKEGEEQSEFFWAHRSSKGSGVANDTWLYRRREAPNVTNIIDVSLEAIEEKARRPDHPFPSIE